MAHNSTCVEFIELLVLAAFPDRYFEDHSFADMTNMQFIALFRNGISFSSETIQILVFNCIYRNHRKVFRNCDLIVGENIEIVLALQPRGQKGGRHHNGKTDQLLEKRKWL
jgi:hypothetical protein